MPRGGKDKKAVSPPAEEEKVLSCDEEEDEPGDSPAAVTSSQPLGGTGSRKRNCGEMEENGCGGEMQSLLATFGADIAKTLDVKRRRLESFTQVSVKTSNKKVQEIWKAQQSERQRLSEEYKKQVLGVLSQWESDVQKNKEAEEKLQNLFKQQHKLFQQQRIVQSQRLKTIRQLHDQFTKGMAELDQCHEEQQVSMQVELKKEMSLLQKKIMMENQQQELSNVRRSLQSMLAQV